MTSGTFKQKISDFNEKKCIFDFLPDINFQIFI